MNPQLQLMLQQAIQAFQNGNFESADLILQEVLQKNINSADVVLELGIAYAKANRFIEASAIFCCLLLYRNNDVRIPYNLGLIRSLQGKHLLALEAYDAALKIQPNDVEVLINKGSVCNDIKDYISALEVLEKAIQIRSNIPEAWSNKGIALNNLNLYQDSINAYNEAIKLNSNYYEAWSNKSAPLNKLKLFPEALEACDKALSLRPDYAEGWCNKGVTLHELKRYGEALTHYDKALSLRPDYAEGWYNKGLLLNETARSLDSKICFEKALKQNPKFHKARWAKLFSSIPVIAIDNESLQQLRTEFNDGLEELTKWFQSENLDEAYEVIGSSQPFYLAYQDFNNKQLLQKYGQLCCLMMNKLQKFCNFQQNIKRENGKIKLGIIGEQIRDHSVWNAITKGIVFNLDASKFEVHIFHLGEMTDRETYFAKLKATSFSNNRSSLLDWIKVIVEKNIDVLLYPEIGMDSISTQLACLRIAPLQIASWGHPETTGLPTIDYYLSSELFEDESSQDFYTETLVKLPNLGCNYSRLPIIPTKFNFEDFGIGPNEPALICPGKPYKYAPQHDWVLANIAKHLGKCKLIFFNYENNLTEALKLRLEKVFNKSNLALGDYVVFIPWLKAEEFYGLMKYADVYLDTIGFSGFNSAIQAVDCALPIVTQEGNFMRGRLASGILKRMSIPELIVKNDKEYVELVVRLVQDRTYRNQIVERIIEMRDILYGDDEPIHAFENFLLSTVERFN